MEDIVYCGLRQQKPPGKEYEGSSTFMKPVHVELADERRYVGVLKILTTCHLVSYCYDYGVISTRTSKLLKTLPLAVLRNYRC